MLKNASTLAIVGLDTAENGPSKVRQVTNRIDAIIGSPSGWRGYGRDELLRPRAAWHGLPPLLPRWLPQDRRLPLRRRGV